MDTEWFLYKELQGTVVKVPKCPAKYGHIDPCLINFNDRAIFKCGGNGSKKVEVYCPSKGDRWD